MINLAQQAWRESNLSLMRQRLEGQQPTRLGDDDPRGFEWFSLDRLRQADLRMLPGPRTDEDLVARFSPDGRTLALAGAQDGTVQLLDVATGTHIRALTGHTFKILGVAFRPDGPQHAAAGRDGSVLIWDAAPLTPESRVPREARSVVALRSAEKRPAAEVADRIRRDPTLGDEVRARALALAQQAEEAAD